MQWWVVGMVGAMFQKARKENFELTNTSHVIYIAIEYEDLIDRTIYV
jgi:hypothetical protein